MHFLNSVLLISCETWPLLWLLLGIGMWLLGWLFGRSTASRYRHELEESNKKYSLLQSENNTLQDDIKVVRNDYDKTNKRLITAENNLGESNNKLNTTLSRFRMMETEKSNLVSERNLSLIHI